MADYAKQDSPLVRRLLQSPLVALASHWTFQSLFYMDRTERFFKIALDICMTIAARTAIRPKLPAPVVWPASFALAHTLNFLFNGHLWGVLKHYDLVHHSYQEFEEYRQGVAERIEGQASIAFAAEYGSLSRDEWKTSSDLDVRMVRFPGLVKAFRACMFLLSERTRALVARFPLDAYVFDSPESLGKLSLKEEAVVLKNENRK